MAFAALALSLVSGFSAIVVIGFLWFLDVFERESWKNLVLAFIFGLAAYALVLSIFAKLAAIAPPSQAGLSLFSAFSALSISTALLLVGQAGAMWSFYRLRRRSFETMTDYVLYACSIGAGFDCAERITTQILNSYGLQPLSNQVYFSAFGFGNYYPFLFSLYGCAFFLWVNSSRMKSYSPRKSGVILASIGVATQLVFALATLLPNIGLRDSYSILSVMSEAIFAVTLNISYLSIAGLIGLCVLMDAHIIERFTEKLEERQEFASFIPWFRYLRHPWYQLCSSHEVLWKFSGVGREVRLPRRLLNQYSRIALRSWLSPGQESQLIQSVYDLLNSASVDSSNQLGAG